MSIKAKWDKLLFQRTNDFMWVFVEGRMFTINETSGQGYIKDKLFQKNFYVLNETDDEKTKIK